MFRALIALAAGLAVGYIHGYHAGDDQAPRWRSWSNNLDVTPDLHYGRGR